MATGEYSQSSWYDQDRQNVFDIEELMRESMREYGDLSSIFEVIVSDISDEQLPEFMKLTERIHNLAFDQPRAPIHELTCLYPGNPDISRAQILADGSYRVPIADRSTLREFFLSEVITDAMQAHYDAQTYHLTLFPEEATGNPEYEIPQPDIKLLPVTIEPLDPNTLLDLINVHYWSEGGEEKYITPADTLKDIAKDIPPEQVMPLILAIESRYPKIIDTDGSYERVIEVSSPNLRTGDGGIVWEIFTPSSLRFDLEDACGPNLTGTHDYNRFDDEAFNQEFYDMLADQDDKRVNESESSTLDNFLEEQNRRHEEIYGW